MKLLYKILIRLTFILGVASYLVTVGIAFVKNGFVIGVLSASLPLLSNAYWAYALWGEPSTFFQIYTNGQILLFFMILATIILQKLKH